MTASPGATASFRHGAGRLCLDYIRTLRYRGRPEATEELPDPAALAAWVVQFGPCQPHPLQPPSQMQLTEARRLREAIYELLIAARGAAETRSVPAPARGSINHAAAHPVPAPRLDSQGRLRWHADDPISATLALIARDALELATSPSAVTRLRSCANPDCATLFLDTSRPATRRWCSMNTCGNQAKKTSLRQKAALTQDTNAVN